MTYHHSADAQFPDVAKLAEEIRSLRRDLTLLRQEASRCIRTENLIVGRGSARARISARDETVVVRLEVGESDYVLELVVSAANDGDEGHAGLFLARNGETLLAAEVIGEEPALWRMSTRPDASR